MAFGGSVLGSIRTRAHRAAQAASVLVVVLALNSCGGGGAAATGGGQPPVTAITLPARPTITYTGNAAAMVYDKTSASDAAAIAMRAIDYAQFLSRDLREGGGSPGTFDVTLNGAAGGTVRLRGTFLANGSGFQVEDFSNYSPVAGLTYQGRIVVEVLQAGGGGVTPTVTVVSYHGITVTQAKYIVAVTGTIGTSFISGMPETVGFDMDLLFDPPGAGSATYFQGVQLDSLRTASSRYLVDVSGRIFDSSAGYIDWDSGQSLEYTSLYGPPHAGGSIAVTADGPPLLVTPRNERWMVLELDEDDDGDHEQTRPLAWDDVFTGSLNATWDLSGPSSNIGANDYSTVGYGIARATVGTDLELDALASSFPMGKFVAHAWSLAWSPQGSTPSFDHTDLPRLKFRPDLAGEYMLVHTATNGAVSVTDRITVQADATVFTDPGNRFAFGSVRRATVGVPLALTFSGIHTPGDPEHVPGFSLLRKPLGSNATLDAGPTTDSRILTPDLPGVYAIISSAPSLGAGDIVEVIADHGVSFEPAVEVGTGGAAVEDLDGDGLGDVILSRPGLGYQSVRQIAPGILSADIQLPAGLTDVRLKIDVDGDGLVDILSHENSLDAQWWKRAADGSYSLEQTLVPLSSTASCSTTNEIAAAREPSGRVVVFFARQCPVQTVDVYAYNGAALVPLTTIGFADHKVDRLHAGDIDGDGLVDAVVSLHSDTFNALGSASVVFATSASAFGPATVVVSATNLGPGPGVVLGTYTNTGRKSIFHSIGDSNPYQAARIYTWNGTGFGSIDTPNVVVQNCMRALDLVGDAREELVTCPHIYEFNPDGSILRTIDFYGGQSNQTVDLSGVAGDVDGDGALDFRSSDGKLRFGSR